MKTMLAFCGLLVGVTAAASAQTEGRLSLKAGLSCPDLAGDAPTLKRKFGGLAGRVAKLDVTKGLSVQADLLYAQKGAAAQNDSCRSRLNYVDLPVLLHYAADSSFVEADAQVGPLLAAKQIQSGHATLDEKPSCRAVGFRYARGLGGHFANGFRMGLRYNADFRAIDQAETYRYCYLDTPLNSHGCAE